MNLNTARGQGALRQDRTEQLSAPASIMSGYARLASLSGVTVKTKDAFLKDLKEIQHLIEVLPLAFPDNGSYQLTLEGGALHVYPRAGTRMKFQLLSGDITLESMEQDGSGTCLGFAKGASKRWAVVLHSNASKGTESGEQDVSRRTSPWRRREAASTPTYTSSESRQGVGSGER